MKRFIVLLMAMVYFAVSSGFSVHVHYCMGHYVSSSLIETEKERHYCTHCGMTKKSGGNGCCHDQHKLVKSGTDHAMAKQLVLSSPAFQAVLPLRYMTQQTAAFTTCREAGSFQPHAPPEPDPACPVFLSIRNLRI